MDVFENNWGTIKATSLKYYLSKDASDWTTKISFDMFIFSIRALKGAFKDILRHFKPCFLNLNLPLWNQTDYTLILNGNSKSKKFEIDSF